MAMNRRRNLLTAAILFLVIGFVQVKALSGPSGFALYALYFVGTVAAYSVQFLVDTRNVVAAYSVGVIVAIIMLVAHLPVLALLIMQFGLFSTFYRFPLRRALVLGTIPTILFVAIGVAVYRETPVGSETTILVVCLVYLFDIITGVTRRQNMIANQHLTWTREQLDREMARNANLAIVRERARIARDMHDILAHSLTALSVQLQAARQTITTDPKQTAQILDEMATTLRQSVGESRQLVEVLREATAPGDDDVTIAAQLQRVANQFSQRTGLQVTLDEHGTPRPLPPDTIIALRYITQEALTNAFKHGSARHMRLTLDWSDTALSLHAEDDGTAQPAEPPLDSGNGLRGMRERLEALSGAFSAGPRVGESGFAVTVEVPYQQTQAQTREKQAV